MITITNVLSVVCLDLVSLCKYLDSLCFSSLLVSSLSLSNGELTPILFVTGTLYTVLGVDGPVLSSMSSNCESL